MKKRLMATLWIATMILAIATACGKNDSKANTSGDEPSSVVAGVEETTGAPGKGAEGQNFDYSEMLGSYSDTYSQRAMMTITEGENGIEIEVDWSSSWCEYSRWTMTATYDASSKRFVYTNEKREDIASDDAEGGAKCDVVYEGQSGYFEWSDRNKTLAWTGAYDADCRECVFKRDDYLAAGVKADDYEENMAEESAGDMDVDSVIGGTYASIQEELDAVEAMSKQFEETMTGDYPQTTLNFAARDYYEFWDAELNSLWSRLSKELDANTKATLLEEQRGWIGEKEAAMAEKAAEYEGGSMAPLAQYTTGGDWTRVRVYTLAHKLAEVRGESYSSPRD